MKSEEIGFNFQDLYHLFSSLRFRLVVGAVILVALAVGIVAYVATYRTRTQFSQLLTRDQLLQYNRQLTVLEDYYRQNGSWEGIQTLISRLGKQSGDRIVLTDASGREVGTYNAELFRSSSEEGTSWLISPVIVESRRAGQLYILKEGASRLEQSFLNSVQKSVVLASLITGMTGILLALLFSRAITKPLNSLISAARGLKEGNLNERVNKETGGEIGELAESFNSMAAELQKQENLRQNMVNDVAHELRSPLSNIRGYTESLQKGVEKPDQELLDSIHEESLALSKLIGDLEDLAKAEAGQLELDLKLVAIDDIIDKALDSIRDLAEENDVSIIKDLPESGPVLVRLDPDRINEVLRNLMENAIRHTPGGGEVRLKLRKKREKIKISVSDNGEGIPRSDLPHVFERFYRVDKSRSRTTGGSGLGLTIVKKIVEAHGGNISVESKKGKGTTFWFTLPLRD